MRMDPKRQGIHTLLLEQLS